MLDIRFIRENSEVVKKNLQKRAASEKIKLVDEAKKLDAEWKKIKFELDELNHKRNFVSEQINKAKKEGKNFSELQRQAQKIIDGVNSAEKRIAELEEKIKNALLQLPNVLDDSVPVGKDAGENVETRKWGKLPKFDFEIKSHGELAEELGVADFKKSAKISGTGFVFVKGALALLDQAIMRFAMDFLLKKGFMLVEPPLMLGRKAYEGVVDLADFENVMYKVENEDLYLIATSEHPLVAMHMDETFEEKELPVRYVGVSPCFRKEIGSHGVDTRGFFRMHQFNKVEQVVFCRPEESYALLEEIQKNSEEMLQALEIPFRVVNICTGDIGNIAAKKYDIEAWFPREKKYGEVGSASNCTSYQAASLNIRYRKKDGTKEYVHTLNNTGLATSRIMRAIIENCQQKDGSIMIPKVLWPYTNGIKIIKRTR